MSLANDTLAHLGDVEDPIALKNFLLLLIQQIDLIIGNRVVEVELSYIKVEPGVAYTQSEVVAIADEVKSLRDRLDTLEARLIPVNN